MGYNTSPYTCQQAFLRDLNEGMVSNARYYATLGAWIKDGSGFASRGRVVKLHCLEQWKNGVINLDGTVNQQVLDAQTPHWIWNCERDENISRVGYADMRFRVGGHERLANRAQLGQPHCDKGTVYAYGYDRPKTALHGRKTTLWDLPRKRDRHDYGKDDTGFKDGRNK